MLSLYDCSLYVPLLYYGYLLKQITEVLTHKYKHQLISILGEDNICQIVMFNHLSFQADT